MYIVYVNKKTFQNEDKKMKYSTLINNINKVIRLYCAENGCFSSVKTEIIGIRHPESEKDLNTYNTTIVDIAWDTKDNSDETTLVLDERDGTVHILADMQSGIADDSENLGDYEWADLTAFVCDKDVENFDERIKFLICEKAIEHRNTMNYTVQACYAGQTIPDEEIKRFEDEAEKAIDNATMGDFYEAYDRLVSYECEEITPTAIMIEVGEHKAHSEYESLKIASVNVWD